ncbi:MAG: restriction endonuclease, SacI family [Isosphaeraceae bacterium]
MPIALDHDAATQILLEEAAAASFGEANPSVLAWRERVDRLGALCPHGRSATLIAALGTALLAKAANAEVDVFSLLDRGEAPNSYSARSLAPKQA